MTTAVRKFLMARLKRMVAASANARSQFTPENAPRVVALFEQFVWDISAERFEEFRLRPPAPFSTPRG